MSMLKKLRNSSEEEKFFFLFWGTIISLFFIGLIWYFLSGVEWGSIQYGGKNLTEQDSGIKFIWELFQNIFNGILEDLNEIKSNFLQAI